MKSYSHLFVINLEMLTTGSCRTMEGRSTSHTSLDARELSEMVEDTTRASRHQPHGEHVARPKGIYLTRSQAACKGWTCGSYSSFLECSGHCKVKVHLPSQKGCAKGHRNGRWSNWLLTLHWCMQFPHTILDVHEYQNYSNYLYTLYNCHCEREEKCMKCRGIPWSLTNLKSLTCLTQSIKANFPYIFKLNGYSPILWKLFENFLLQFPQFIKW